MSHPTERRSLLYVYDSVTDAWIPAKGDADGNLYMELESADIQIGAVEVKNATTDDRLTVTANGDAQVTLDSEVVAVDATGQGDVPVTLDSEQVAISDADAYTTPTHTAVNVTTGTGEVLASNANRLYALLVNDSDTTIYIKLGVAAVANQGIRLNANGGNYEMSAMLGNLYTGAINGIHGGTGNKALLMTEGV